MQSMARSKQNVGSALINGVGGLIRLEPQLTA